VLRKVLALGVLVGLGLPLAAQAGRPGASVETLLAEADRHRHPWPSFRVDVRMGEGRSEQRWRVHARENGDARVEGLSEKERGRSVLVLGDDMWLLLPNAKRPVKVSPQQRLMGPASGGDLARTRFREDYAGIGEPVPEAVAGEPCLRMELKARRPAVAHQQATLWVARTGSRPVKAEFRLASGKLARTVTFEAGPAVAGRAVIQAMHLEAPDGSRVTLHFAGWASEPPDEARFALPQLP